MTTIRVWDLPTRLFHWSLAALVIALVATAKLGWMNWHVWLGYAVLALLLFRWGWGWMGGHWSRFSRFVYAPTSVIAYLRGQSPLQHRIGHSPLGALSVWAVFAVLLAQVGTGLISDDEIAFTGPLNRFVSTATGLAATSYHRQWGQWLIIGLVALHIAAILFYLVRRRDNLIVAMVTGDKTLREVPYTPIPASRDDAGSWLRASLWAAVCAAATYALITLAV